MKTTTLGPAGLACEAIGLGTWAMGGWMWGGTDEAAAPEAIRASLDAGVRLSDIFTDVTYVLVARDTTVFARAVLAPSSLANVLVGLYLLRAYRWRTERAPDH